MTFEFTPISEHIGAAVDGPDLDTVADGAAIQLREMLVEYAVLVFRRQKLDPAKLLEVLRGRLHS